MSFAAASAAALPAVTVPREPYVPTPLSTARVGMADHEARGGKAELLAEDLRENGLEPGPHRRRAGVDDERPVGARLDLRGLERPQSRLLDVHGEPDAAPHASAGRVRARLLGTRLRSRAGAADRRTARENRRSRRRC